MITLSSEGGYSVTLPTPQYGYKSILRLPFHYFKVNKTYKIWDDGASYDIRICEVPVWTMDGTQQADFANFFRTIVKGRSNNFSLNLGAGASGFFPFGPDLGDHGTFVCHFLDIGKSGILWSPYRWYKSSIKFVLVPGSTLPTHTPPLPEDEGQLLITFSGESALKMMYPQQPPQPTHTMGLQNVLLRSGDVARVDPGEKSDRYETKLYLYMHPGNASKLIQYIRQYRYAPIRITPPAYASLFGVDKVAVTNFDCILIERDVVISHDKYHRFSTTLSLNDFAES